jgi:hypothetical protein
VSAQARVQGRPNPERDNPLLFWEHEGLDIEWVAALPAARRCTVLWEHSKKHVYARIPHYAELLRAAGDPAWPDLGAVPTFDRTLDWAGGGVLNDDYRSDCHYFSGGTTQRHKVLHSDLREDAYLNAVRALQYALDPRPYRALSLRPIDVTHGMSAPIPELHGNATVALPMASEPDYAEAARLLLENGTDNPTQKVVSIRSQTGTVLGLTAYLVESGVDPSRLAVETLLHGAFHLSTVCRRRLQDYWNCEVRDMYGCTEFYQSYGMRCAHCLAYHFNWTILVEVTGFGGEPIQHGVGELTLTHLAPFALRQPLLRYRTGDLAQIDGVCDVTGRDRYLFGGRIRDAVKLVPGPAEHGIEGSFLTALQLKDAIETLPFAEREHNKMLDLGVYKSDDITPPVMDWEYAVDDSGRTRIEVRIGLREEYRDRCGEIPRFAEQATERILAESALLRTKVDAGEASLTCLIVAPGRLDATAKAV